MTPRNWNPKTSSVMVPLMEIVKEGRENLQEITVLLFSLHLIGELFGQSRWQLN